MSLFRNMLFINIILFLLTGCFHSNTRPTSLNDKTNYLHYFSNFKYDVIENTELMQVYSELSSFTTVDFNFDPELTDTIRYVDTRLPMLVGFSVDELIRIIPEVVTPEVEFEYVYESGGRVRLHLRYQETEI